MRQISLTVYFDEKVANTSFVIVDLSEGDILVEDMVEYTPQPELVLTIPPVSTLYLLVI